MAETKNSITPATKKGRWKKRGPEPAANGEKCASRPAYSSQNVVPTSAVAAAA